jgi:hypothetical protein
MCSEPSLPFSLETGNNEATPPQIGIIEFIEEEISLPADLDSHLGTIFCPMEPITQDTY